MPPTSSRRKPVRRSKVSSQTTLRVASGGGGGNLAKAAEDIADGIRARSAEFSRKIPTGVHVGQGSATTAVVYASVEPAYAIETGSRHPVFATGPRETWHWAKEPMKQISFMEEGAARMLDQAAKDYGFGEIDDWLKQVDW